MKGAINRRDFLRIVGYSSPFLFPLFSTLRVNAATNPRKKLVFLHWSNGYTKQFNPKKFGSGGNFQTSYVLEPLNPHKEDLVVLHRLNTRLTERDNPSHNAPQMLTANIIKQNDLPEGESIDVFLARKLNTPIDCLRLNIDGSRKSTSKIYNSMCWANGKKAMNMSKSPSDAYNYVFKGFKFSSSKQESVITNKPKKILENKKSIIDYVKSDFDSLKKHLSKTEKTKFESHFDLFRKFETNIERDIANLDKEPPETSSQCKQPDVPSTSLSLQKRSTVMSDLAVAAMACDRTDISAIMMSEGVSNLTFPHLNGRGGIRIFDKAPHHKASHYYKKDGCSDFVTKIPGVTLATLERIKSEMDRWYMQEMSYIVTQMKQFDIFENSLVMMGNDMGEDSHSCRKSSFVLAGSLGGFFKTNFAKDYRGSGSINHSSVLAAILEAFGEKKGVRFGNPRYSKTALADLIA